MSEIKALEELRHHAHVLKGCSTGYNELFEIADEIEAEIAERFMELPVDADGVPIHVGDVMEYENPNDDDKPFTILGVNNDGDVFHCIEDKRLVPTCISLANCLCHVKPRSLEDVMAEYEELAANQNVKDYFEVSKELRTIQSEQFRDEPELELYKEVNGCRFYIELPYDELWIMTDKVEVKHHSYSYRYERPNGNTVVSCSSLCGYQREWAIERLDEAIEEIRELMGVGE